MRQVATGVWHDLYIEKAHAPLSLSQLILTVVKRFLEVSHSSYLKAMSYMFTESGLPFHIKGGGGESYGLINCLMTIANFVKSYMTFNLF